MAQIQVQPPNPNPPQQQPAGNGSNNQIVPLYVGDLEPSVIEGQIYDLFQQIGPVHSVRICRDVRTNSSLGYGYVNYSTVENASRALGQLNFTPLNGKPIRIMYSNRYSNIPTSASANIFIKNLDKAIDSKALYHIFCVFGPILSSKVATDASGRSKGHGFVQFEQDRAAQNAIEKMNGMLFNGKQVYVGPFMKKQDREQANGKAELHTVSVNNLSESLNNEDERANGKAKLHTVFVKNFSESLNDEELRNYFGEYGAVTNVVVVVLRDAEGNSKCFGFVNYENADAAAKCVASLNGQKIDGKKWYLEKAQMNPELRGGFGKLKERLEKFQGANLYLKNLDDSIDDNKLRELFSGYGTIISCKVVMDLPGHGRGSRFGLVAFSSRDEASRALAEMNGKICFLAQRKEERSPMLQAYLSQLRIL